jgi:thymidylate synthase (FAD)
MAGICYNAKRDPASNKRRASKCKDDGHLATMRFASATFHIEGISRITSHQMVRHKFLDFLQRSQRYCSEKDIDFIQPDKLAEMPDEVRAAWGRTEAMARHTYELAIQHGMKKEDARYILPHSGTTQLVVTGSFQAWYDFLYGKAGRLQKAAQWEIKAVAEEIQRQLHEIAPEIFGE